MQNPSELLKFSRQLKEHQKQVIDRFATRSEMALLWEAGAMKTTAAIGWLRWKYAQAGEVTPTLIIGPVAVLYNWRDEFNLNSPEKVSSEVLVPYMKGRRTKYKGAERAYHIKTSKKKIVILNPESLDMQEVVEALLKFNPENVVVDEADGFKNHESKRLKQLLAISDKAQNRCIMTGTPILNSYLDIWAQWRILDQGETFGRNFFVFRERYFRDENLAWKGKPKYFPHYVPRQGIDTELSELIALKGSRILKKDCLDLPEQVFIKDYVELSAEQEKAYKGMEKELIAQVAAGTCAASNALCRVLRLLQILSGHLPVEHDELGEKYTAIFKNTPRLDRLKYWIEQLTSNHKIIIWCNFAANYVSIRQILNDLGIEFAEITGETKDAHAEKERFQTTEAVRVMLANPQAGGIGINLQQASYAIYYSRNHSLRQRLQSLARNFRGGSEIHDKITVIDLIAKDTIDEAVFECLERKENFSDLVLDRLKELR